ncbi:hypothetical protein OOK36_24090 [Streptomyces sp. NBC_00365]|uniref:hypothetical protein n=1 Tax=Streptomyces sp. NBC_00365 TaxID=2975726 RepID=UPI002252FBD3|nr:hypothetical protein [Streptomyces sp. NBC_00365]MCX5091898.1 hypothetical protein [Streptomyces sp. NBC_00365]
MASHTARTLTDLADHIGTEQQHRDALIRWDPEKYKRVHALTYADLGDSLASQARADEAVAAWSQALILMEGMTSDRTRKAITSLRSTLSVYQRRKVPGATAHEWTGEPENREPRKHAQVRWVDADAVPEDFVGTTASALNRYLAGGPQVSLDGWE